ncbi:MAG: dihydroneopterin aldolase [Ignavibacteria bacterium]|jgi:dihydroneopterin aldolase|nr:dihydroneopterin aldolase [Ignavibacteria bacterium]
MTKIQIKNAIYYCYNGVSTAEKALGGKYQLDLDIYYDATKAIESDDVSYAINYNDVLFTVSDIVENETFNLIETLADNILLNLLEEYDLVEKATVRIRKIDVPINHCVDYVEVEASKER